MTYPVMSYAAAHAWEHQAAERGVSEVARSARGFMRAYERAGSFRALDPWWQRRREGFIARHMAQANRGERLWEKVHGAWRPTRRALALIMWAYMPPGRPSGVSVRENPRTQFLDYDARRDPKTDCYCVKCQRDIKNKEKARLVRIVEVQGAPHIVHPDDVRSGEGVDYLIGPECVKTVGRDWTSPLPTTNPVVYRIMLRRIRR